MGKEDRQNGVTRRKFIKMVGSRRYCRGRILFTAAFLSGSGEGLHPDWPSYAVHRAHRCFRGNLRVD